MDAGLGMRVRTLRRRRGLSQETFAHLVGKSERWLRDVEAGTVGLWVRDALHMAEVLKVDVAELIGSPGDAHAGAGPQPDDAMRVDTERLAMALGRGTAVDVELAASLGAVVRHLPGHLGVLSCPSLVRLADAHLLSLRVLLGEAAPGPVQRELASAAAETGVLAGMLCIALGQGDRAEAYLRLAASLAGRAGDARTRLRALVYNSQLYSCAFMDGRPEDPVRSRTLLAHAARLAGRDGAARALCLMRQAIERAVLREERAAYSLLDEADRAHASGGTSGRAAPWWWHRSFPAAFRGKAAMLVGHPDQAIPLLEAVLVTFDPGMANRSRMIAELGAAYAQVGEIEHACIMLGRALELDRTAGVVGSMPRTRHIRERELRRFATEPAVRRLDEQLRDTAGSGSILSVPATASVSATVGAWVGGAPMASAV